MQELCDEDNIHSIINTLGQCFTEFKVSYDSANVSELENTIFTHLLDDEPEEIADLSLLARLDMDESYTCGKFGFKLANTTQENLVEVTKEGILSIKTIEETSWLGPH